MFYQKLWLRQSFIMNSVARCVCVRAWVRVFLSATVAISAIGMEKKSQTEAQTENKVNRVREKESNLTIHRLTFLPSFHLFFSFFQFASKVFFCHKDDFSFSLLLSRILWKRIILKGHQLRLQTIFCFFWTKTKINLCTMVAIKPKRVKILSIEISRAFDIKSLSHVWHSEIDCCTSDWNWASCELIL